LKFPDSWFDPPRKFILRKFGFCKFMVAGGAEWRRKWKGGRRLPGFTRCPYYFPRCAVSSDYRALHRCHNRLLDIIAGEKVLYVSTRSQSQLVHARG
jgi:hypothetical protein